MAKLRMFLPVGNIRGFCLRESLLKTAGSMLGKFLEAHGSLAQWVGELFELLLRDFQYYLEFWDYIRCKYIVYPMDVALLQNI